MGKDRLVVTAALVYETMRAQRYAYIDLRNYIMKYNKIWDKRATLNLVTKPTRNNRLAGTALLTKIVYISKWTL